MRVDLQAIVDPVFVALRSPAANREIFLNLLLLLVL